MPDANLYVILPTVLLIAWACALLLLDELVIKRKGITALLAAVGLALALGVALVVTPHAAWYSEEAEPELRRRAARTIVQALRGERPTTLLNPEVCG